MNRKKLKLRNSVFVDERHYLETNPEVCQIGLDAALTTWYTPDRRPRSWSVLLSRGIFAPYPDVAEANLNPLLHYEAHCRRENRRVLPYSAKNSHPPQTLDEEMPSAGLYSDLTL